MAHLGNRRLPRRTGAYSNAHFSRYHRKRFRRLVAEQLEARLVLAAMAWDGEAHDGLWTSALNWSGNVIPGIDDDVTIQIPSDDTIFVRGSTPQIKTLVNHGRIWLEGRSDVGFAKLTVTHDLINHGVIRMESTSNNDFYDEGSYLTVTEGVLTNAADGRIEVLAGTGDGRVVLAEVVNEGTLRADADFSLGRSQAAHINRGLISLQNASLTLEGLSFTNHVGGLISGSGMLNATQITLTNQGVIDLSAPSILDVKLDPGLIEVQYIAPSGMELDLVRNRANYTLHNSGGDGTFHDGNEQDLSSLITGITYNTTTQTAAFTLLPRLELSVPECLI